MITNPYVIVPVKETDSNGTVVWNVIRRSGEPDRYHINYIIAAKIMKKMNQQLENENV